MYDIIHPVREPSETPRRSVARRRGPPSGETTPRLQLPRSDFCGAGPRLPHGAEVATPRVINNDRLRFQVPGRRRGKHARHLERYWAVPANCSNRNRALRKSQRRGVAPHGNPVQCYRLHHPRVEAAHHHVGPPTIGSRVGEPAVAISRGPYLSK